jgi:hypothetical protein
VEEVSPVDEVELAVGCDVLDGVNCLVEEVEVSPVEVELDVGGGVGAVGPVSGPASSCLQNPFIIDVADAMASAWEVLHPVEATEDAAETAPAN